MRISLTNELWEILRPDPEDKHTGLGEWTPEWSPVQDVYIFPVYTKKITLEGTTIYKAFYLYKGEECIGVVRLNDEKITYLNIDDNISIECEDNKTVLWGENIVPFAK